MECNSYYPHILIATSSYIGARFDLIDAYAIIYIGLLISILNLIQEMGRCSYKRINDGSSLTDKFMLNVRLSDYVHLHERLFIKMSEKEINHPLRVINFYM